MRRNVIETIVAAVVLLVAGAFVVFVIDQTQPPRLEGYSLTARFAQAPTLRSGAEVRIAGVVVGRVSTVELDAQRYDVQVAMVIRPDISLPSDTRATLDFDGLMGDAVIVLRPGRDEVALKAGDRIWNTVSPVNIVDQFGRFIYGGGAGALDDF